MDDASFKLAVAISNARTRDDNPIEVRREMTDALSHHECLSLHKRDESLSSAPRADLIKVGHDRRRHLRRSASLHNNEESLLSSSAHPPSQSA